MSNRLTSHLGHTVMSCLVFHFSVVFAKRTPVAYLFHSPSFPSLILSPSLLSILCTYETPLGLGIFYIWASIRVFPECNFLCTARISTHGRRNNFFFFQSTIQSLIIL